VALRLGAVKTRLAEVRAPEEDYNSPAVVKATVVDVGVRLNQWMASKLRR
jgi:hypothetical protein